MLLIPIELLVLAGIGWGVWRFFQQRRAIARLEDENRRLADRNRELADALLRMDDRPGPRDSKSA